MEGDSDAIKLDGLLLCVWEYGRVGGLGLFHSRFKNSGT